MPKRPDAYMADRRSSIIDALDRCVKRVGWEGATIDEVGREAGLSKGAVYHHFKNKRELLLGLIERDLSAIGDIASQPTKESLRETMIAQMTQHQEKGGWRAVTGVLETWIAGARDDEIRAMLGEGVERVVQALTAVVQRLRPEVDAHTARGMALNLLAMMNGMTVMGAFEARLTRRDIERMVDLMLRLMFGDNSEGD